MEFTLDLLTILQFVAATLLPIVVGLVTSKVTHSGTKAVLLAALTLATSLVAEAIRAVEAGEVYDLGTALFLALPAFATSVAFHYGLLKPAGVSEAAQEAFHKPSGGGADVVR